jgi:hypothetical protein
LAQRQAAEQDVLLREVDEAVRKDEMSGAVRKYGVAAGLAAVVGLAAFGGYLFWQDHREGQRGEQSELLVTALDKLDAGQVRRADEELAPLAEGEGGLATVARLTRAAIALQDGKPSEATALYDAVATDTSAPQPYRDLATVRSVAAQFDALPPQQVIDRLKPLAVPGAAWFGSAGELVAMAYIKQGKRDLAGPLLAEISKDETVPQSLRSRTRQLAGLLGFDAITDVEATLGEARQATSAAPQ